MGAGDADGDGGGGAQGGVAPICVMPESDGIHRRGYCQLVLELDVLWRTGT